MVHINERQLFTAIAVGYICRGVIQIDGFLCVVVIVVFGGLFFFFVTKYVCLLVWFGSPFSQHVTLKAPVNIALSHIIAES